MIAGSSILIALLIVLNEVLKTQNGCDYRSSLDADVNRENESCQIFTHKNFQITSMKRDSGTAMWATRSWSPAKQLLSSMGLVIIKLKGLFVYYFPFFILNITFGILNFGTKTWISGWFPVIGAFIGTILIRFISAKLLFLISSIIQIISLVVLTISLEFLLTPPFTSTHITLCILLFAFGLSYATNDILILDSASLQNSEIFLGFGFVIEMFLFGTLQIISYSSIKGINNVVIYIEPYTFPITFLIFISLFVVIFLVPNTFQKSILEIRNTINGFGNNPNPYPMQNPYQNPNPYQNQNQNPNPNPYNYNTQNIQPMEQPIPRVSRVPINNDLYPRIPKVDYI